MSLRARNQTYSIAGTSGVAYAGGASSGPVSRSPTQLRSSSSPRETIFEGTRSGKPVGRRNTTSCDMDRETRGHYRRGTPPSPPIPHQYTDLLPSTSPSGARLTTRSPTPTGESVEVRAPDKSLPVPEEEVGDAYAQIEKQEPGQERGQWMPGDDEAGRPRHRHEQIVPDSGRQHSTSSPPTTSSSLVVADYHGYLHSPHSRQGEPIPPTPHSYTSSPSLLPLIVTGMEPVLPPYSPITRVASPFPYPFGDIRRMINAGSDTGLSQMDPNVALEQRVLQWQAYARNEGGMFSDSTLSPSSMPLPGQQYNPWTFLRTSASSRRRGDITDSQASTRSSPSHLPIALPPFSRGYRGPHRRGRSEDSHKQSKTRPPPPRVESTQPQDTSPELSSGEETVGDFDVCNQSESQHSGSRSVQWDESADDEGDVDETGKWIDEGMGTEGVADDLLRFEFHTDYVGDPGNRRQRSKHLWEALLRVVSFPATFSRQSKTVISKFHALDRETNIPLVLLAAPSHTGKLHSAVSRAARRDDSLRSTDMTNIRSAFAQIVSRQHTLRPTSMLEQLPGPCSSSSSDDGLPLSSSSGREDLCRSLNNAISSLHALGRLYERQATSCIEEKHRLDEEKETILLLFKQVLDAGVFGNLAKRARQRRWPTYCRRVLTSLLLLLLVFWPCLSPLRIAEMVSLRPCVSG